MLARWTCKPDRAAFSNGQPPVRFDRRQNTNYATVRDSFTHFPLLFRVFPASDRYFCEATTRARWFSSDKDSVRHGESKKCQTDVTIQSEPFVSIQNPDDSFQLRICTAKNRSLSFVRLALSRRQAQETERFFVLCNAACHHQLRS